MHHIQSHANNVDLVMRDFRSAIGFPLDTLGLKFVNISADFHRYFCSLFKLADYIN